MSALKSGDAGSSITLSTLLAEKDIGEAVFKNVPVGLAVSDIETGTLLEANGFFLGLVGYTRDELIGHTSYDLGLWPDIKEREKIAERLLHNGHVRNIEVPLRTKDGRILTILASFELLHILSRPSVLGMAVDITEKKLYQKKLKELEAAGKSSTRTRKALSYPSFPFRLSRAMAATLEIRRTGLRFAS